MNVIFVTAGMSGGGTERVISILANKWIDDGHSVSIVMTADSTVSYKLDKKIKLIELAEKTNGSLIKRIKRIYQLHSLFKKEKDAVICAMGVETNMYTVLAAKGLKNKVIISERNDPNQCSYQKLRNILYRKADKLVCQTYDAASHFKKSGMNNTCVIANPLNPLIPLPYAGKRKKTIVAVGRLTNQKNHKMLVKVFGEFHKKFSEYILEIFGKGELQDELQQQIIQSGLQTCTFLKGFSKNVLEEIKDCSMYILPSDYEGISNSLMEAMAIGLPVISTDCPIGGSAMCIQNGVNGFLTPLGNEKAMLNCMTLLAEKEDMLQQISQEATKIRTKYSADEISNLWMEMMKEDYA